MESLSSADMSLGPVGLHFNNSISVSLGFSELGEVLVGSGSVSEDSVGIDNTLFLQAGGVVLDSSFEILSSEGVVA